MQRWLQRHSAYWRLKTRDAIAGTFARANFWAALIGGFVLWGGASFGDRFFHILNKQAPVTTGDTLYFNGVVAVVSFGAVWAAIAFWRLCGAGARLHDRSQMEIQKLQAQLADLMSKKEKLKLVLSDDRDPERPTDIADPADKSSGSYRGHFVHLWPKNLTAVPLKNATVKVIEIARYESGRWEIANRHTASQPLRWAGTMEETDRFAPRALIPGDRQKVDLFNIGARNDLLKLNVRESCPDPFFKKGIYRIKALVSADEVPPAGCSVIVEWTGNWEDCSVYEGNEWTRK
jgi:hypothetical protein